MYQSYNVREKRNVHPRTTLSMSQSPGMSCIERKKDGRTSAGWRIENVGCQVARNSSLKIVLMSGEREVPV